MKAYSTTESIHEAIHDLTEGDIIHVPQYVNALEVEYLGDLNGETNAFVGVRFADESKRTSTNKTIITNKNSGRAYLTAGTSDKGAVTQLIVIESAADDADDDDDAEAEAEAEPEPDSLGHDEPIEVEHPIGTLVTEQSDDDEAGYVDLEQLAPEDPVADADAEPIFDEATPFDVHGQDDEIDAAEREIEERTRTFEEDYRHEVRLAAECIIEELRDDLGEDFEHVTRNDLPEVADREVGETLAFHEYITESHYYLDVIEASPSDPDACTWQDYVNFADSPDANDVLGAMAYVVFRQDIRDALRGVF